MLRLPTFATLAVLGLCSTTLAQDNSVNVDLSGITADLIAELGGRIDELPPTIMLSAEAAAAACGLDVSTVGDECVAIIATEELTSAVEDDMDDGNNSAAEFAPGQQDGNAKDFAPGQQDGDAKDFAPGQVKNDGDSSGQQENSGRGTAPGQN